MERQELKTEVSVAKDSGCGESKTTKTGDTGKHTHTHTHVNTARHTTPLGSMKGQTLSALISPSLLL